MSDSGNNEWESLLNIEDVPGVTHLYDLVGFTLDMTFAAECFDKLALSIDQCDESRSPSDWIEQQAFFSAGAIAYNRCFGTGIRGSLSKDVLDRLAQDAPGAAREVDKFICDMRDKHIAHSVSPFEAVMISGRLEPADEDGNQLVMAGWMTMAGLPLGADQARTCRDLARCIVNQLNVEIKDLQAEIQEALKREVSETAALRPPMTYVIPGADQAGTPRRFGRGIAP